MEIVAGITFKQFEPRVWDPESPYYLPRLRAVMVSFTDFHRNKKLREQTLKHGIHKALGIPKNVRIYLDNGAFGNIRAGRELPVDAYWEFVTKAKPHWYPVPADFIPLPDMSEAEQRACYRKTMKYNRDYSFDGCVPVIHAGEKLPQYLKAIKAHEALSQKKELALGGLVPQFLQTKGTGPRTRAIDFILTVRQQFDGKIHAFGIGGTATLHLAALLGLDSIDSAGWRNRAARGMIQLPGHGERLLTQLGSWQGRELSRKERALLKECECPGCRQAGIRGLSASGTVGFARRATHNLYVLLEELIEVEARIKHDTYQSWYPTHVFNDMFLRLIEYALNQLAISSARANSKTEWEGKIHHLSI